ncbi:MAG TPA: FAD-dependent oxidoreductase [Mycobacteriales bacterium]|nr:FAD-dependent oxidoreductase [Mycobacteriales bacterium]
MSGYPALRIAVIGAGPAGIYVADALVEQTDVPATVDIFDRLPTPFGLLRYGVAPDHLKMKSMSRTLQRTLDHDNVRFFGNIELGRDLTIEELLGDYHAVIYAFGAATDRHLGIPGEDLPGSDSARHFVSWYCGDPDTAPDAFELTAKSVAVIGLGNVALDAARVLARDPEELAPTDVPDNVLDALRRSAVTDVHIVGRRGPQHAKFTTKELREIGELAGVDVLMDPAALDDVGEPTETVVRRNLEVFRDWAGRSPTGAPRRIHMHFFSRPAAMLGDDQVEALRVEHPDGSTTDIEAQLVLRSVGYRGVRLDGLPFDEESGTVPTADSRVRRDGTASGEYACGWISRGATGVIGTNRHSAQGTMQSVIADADALRRRDTKPGSALEAAMARGARPVTLEGWAAIDAEEIARGKVRNNPRVKLAQWEELLSAANPVTKG